MSSLVLTMKRLSFYFLFIVSDNWFVVVERERRLMLVQRLILTFTMSFITISLGLINPKMFYVGETKIIPSICLALKSLMMAR